uniref:TLC domain-containing protein n=1 Tax=Wuchereria bancrofti TaxID=6293 RepID=A0AAF5Q5I6_WUCBA
MDCHAAHLLSIFHYSTGIIRRSCFNTVVLNNADYRWENIQPPIVPRLFALMLLSLLILHIYWTIIIMKIALKSVKGAPSILGPGAPSILGPGAPSILGPGKP